MIIVCAQNRSRTRTRDFQTQTTAQITLSLQLSTTSWTNNSIMQLYQDTTSWTNYSIMQLERRQQVWAVQAWKMCRKTEGLEYWLIIDAKRVWADIYLPILQCCVATLHIWQVQTTLPHRHKLNECLYPHKKKRLPNAVACADKGTRTPTPLGIRS